MSLLASLFHAALVFISLYSPMYLSPVQLFNTKSFEIHHGGSLQSAMFLILESIIMLRRREEVPILWFTAPARSQTEGSCDVA